MLKGDPPGFESSNLFTDRLINNFAFRNFTIRLHLSNYFKMLFIIDLLLLSFISNHVVCNFEKILNKKMNLVINLYADEEESNGTYVYNYVAIP